MGWGSKPCPITKRQYGSLELLTLNGEGSFPSWRSNPVKLGRHLTTESAILSTGAKKTQFGLDKPRGSMLECHHCLELGRHTHKGDRHVTAYTYSQKLNHVASLQGISESRPATLGFDTKPECWR